MHLDVIVQFHFEAHRSAMTAARVSHRTTSLLNTVSVTIGRMLTHKAPRAKDRQSRQLLWPLLAALLLAGCSESHKELRIYPMSYQGFDPMAMQQVFEQRSGVQLKRVDRQPGLSGLEALATGKADLAVVANSNRFVPGVRAVLPIHQSVMHLLVRDDISKQVKDLARPLLGRSIYIANNSSAGHSVIEVIAQRQGLDPGDYTIIDQLVPGETDFVLFFGPINTNHTPWFSPGYSFVSLDHQASGPRKFSQEGIGYLIPQMNPFVIPAQTYDLPGNEEAVVTVAVDSLLLTRKELPESQIYQVAKTFIEQKPRFSALSPPLFSSVSQTFDPMELSFPLHSGVRRYLHRDEPGLLERYAETINMLMYVGFLLLTGLIALARWRAQRKKDRIDTFYVRVLSVRERATDEKSIDLLQELDGIEMEAFDSLIAEKLAANESFRIFTDLLSRTRADLRKR